MGQSPDLSEVYRPPSVDVNVVEQRSPSDLATPLYVVSPTKFIILFVCTMGIYQVYWFYAHFRRTKAALRDDTWPLARAAFAIFFAHGLFRRIDSLGGHFNADNNATAWVLLTIVARIIDRVSQSVEELGALDALGIALGMVTAFPLYAAQKAANRACGDPEGTQNSRLTLANFAWCSLGLLLWLLILAGLLLSA